MLLCLSRLVGEHGYDWTRIGGLIGREALVCKDKWRRLKVAKKGICTICIMTIMWQKLSNVLSTVLWKPTVSGHLTACYWHDQCDGLILCHRLGVRTIQRLAVLV